MGKWVPLSDDEIYFEESYLGENYYDRIKFPGRPYRWVGEGDEDLKELEKIAEEQGAEIITFKHFYCLKEKQSCFIATAAYGSPMASELNYFRKFRDERLLEDRVGDKLVKIYYKLSPPFAKVISMSEGARYLTRKLLDPVVKHLKK